MSKHINREMTKKEIKDILDHIGDSDRELIETKIKNQYQTVGTIIYSTNGSPPRAYAMYITSHNILNFYNSTGKRNRQYYDVFDIIN